MGSFLQAIAAPIFHNVGMGVAFEFVEKFYFFSEDEAAHAFIKCNLFDALEIAFIIYHLIDKAVSPANDSIPSDCILVVEFTIAIKKFGFLFVVVHGNFCLRFGYISVIIRLGCNQNTHSPLKLHYFNFSLILGNCFVWLMEFVWVLGLIYIRYFSKWRRKTNSSSNAQTA